jgi:hypothetical protein
MDTLKDFFTSLKDRLTSPFFGSFIVCWIISNYKIAITLLFYKQPELKIDGYKSYLQFIDLNTNIWHTFSFPFIIALVYTFGYPYFKSYITVFLAGIAVDTDEKVYKRSKNATVPISRYMRIKDRLKLQEDELLKLIGDENELAIKIAALESQSRALNKSLSDTLMELQSVQQSDTEKSAQIEILKESHTQNIIELRKDANDAYDALEKENRKLVNDNSVLENDVKEKNREIVFNDEQLRSWNNESQRIEEQKKLLETRLMLSEDKNAILEQEISNLGLGNDRPAGGTNL